MRPISAGLINVDERRRRFLFVDFLVRMWLLPARIRLIFPFPVLRKRFAAPRLVFIFGISTCSWGPVGPSISSTCDRRENHRHDPAFKAREGFNLPHVLEILRDSKEDLPSQLGVRHLPSPKHHGQLDLVSLFQEPPRVAGLEVVIVFLDPGAKLHLFDLNVVLLLLRLSSRALGLVFVLPVVHEFDHGWPSLGRHFHEIQTSVVSEIASFLDRDDTDLPTLVVDQTNRADPYLLIYTNSFLANIPLLLRVEPSAAPRVLAPIHKKTRIFPGHRVTEAAGDPASFPCPGPGGVQRRKWNRKVEPPLRRLASVLSGAPYTGV